MTWGRPGIRPVSLLLWLLLFRRRFWSALGVRRPRVRRLRLRKSPVRLRLPPAATLLKRLHTMQAHLAIAKFIETLSEPNTLSCSWQPVDTLL